MHKAYGNYMHNAYGLMLAHRLRVQNGQRLELPSVLHNASSIVAAESSSLALRNSYTYRRVI